MTKLLIPITLLIAGCSAPQGDWAKVERKCNFSSQEREVAWRNVISHVRSEYPEHARFCELEESAKKQRFLVVKDECRVYLGCSKTVDGEFLTHGDMLVVINEDTREVTKAYGVKW